MRAYAIITARDSCGNAVTPRKVKEIVMREVFSGSMITSAIAIAAVSAVVTSPLTLLSAQAQQLAPVPAVATKTPWGEPDLQGIWTAEDEIPLQRLPKYADQEFFTEAQRTELDRARSELLARERRAERGTKRDVSGSYNNVFVSLKSALARH